VPAFPSSTPLAMVACSMTQHTRLYLGVVKEGWPLRLVSCPPPKLFGRALLLAESVDSNSCRIMLGGKTLRNHRTIPYLIVGSTALGPNGGGKGDGSSSTDRHGRMKGSTPSSTASQRFRQSYSGMCFPAILFFDQRSKIRLRVSLSLIFVPGASCAR
jgi:hypothetical protein